MRYLFLERMRTDEDDMIVAENGESCALVNFIIKLAKPHQEEYEIRAGGLWDDEYTNLYYEDSIDFHKDFNHVWEKGCEL